MKSNKMKRYLITGAGGFIGSYLVEKLANNKNFQIIAIYSKSPTFKNPRVKPVIADLSKPGWTESITNSVEVVYHLAQSQRYRDFPDGSINMAAVNITSTVELLEWSRKNSVEKFIFTSTANVFKKSSCRMESTHQCEPNSMYSATKLSAEYIIKQYEEYFKIIILRLFTIYGPKQRKMLIPSMIEKIIKGDKIFLANGVGIYLTPLFISDCVEALERLLYLKNSKTIRLNISGSDIVNLDKILDIIERCLDKKSIRVTNNEEPLYIMGNNDMSHQIVSYQPKVDIYDGLQKTVKEYVQNVKLKK